MLDPISRTMVSGRSRSKAAATSASLKASSAPAIFTARVFSPGGKSRTTVSVPGQDGSVQTISLTVIAVSGP